MNQLRCSRGAPVKQHGIAAFMLFISAASVCHAQTNALTRAERAAGWRLLFDGRTVAGWRGLGYDSVPWPHWRIKNGAIEGKYRCEIQRL